MSKISLRFQTLPLIFLLLSCFQTLQAQPRITIAYNEKIDLGRVDPKTQFHIQGAATNQHLKGSEINAFVFATPGVYHIKIAEKKIHKPAICNESNLPAEIVVNVSRIRMIFDAAQLSLSAPILKNQDTNGITLSIPVTIETYDHLPAALNFTPVSSAGIGTAIMADLHSDVGELSEGIHTLHYILRGMASENAYVMFDFVDANGQIQSVSLANSIKS